MNSPIRHSTTPPEILFNSQEMLTLNALRDLYQEHPGFFTQRELAGLRFVRWLYRTGKLTEGCEDEQKVT